MSLAPSYPPPVPPFGPLEIAVEVSAACSDLVAKHLRLFDLFGNVQDLEVAVINMRMASAMDPANAAYLHNLAVVLQRRFERFEDADNLHEAIKLEEASLRRTTLSDPDGPSRLNGLATLLALRYSHAGKIEDLDGAIQYLQVAVSLVKDGDLDRLSWLSNLGQHLLRRSGHTNKLDDLEEAIKTLRRVVAASSSAGVSDSERCSRTHNLAVALSHRYERFHETQDLHDAVTNFGDAVDLVPDDHPLKPGKLSDFGNILRIRFEHLRKSRDLSQAIEKQTRALDLLPDGHPNEVALRHNLGNSLLRKAEMTSNPTHIEDCIQCHLHVVNSTSDDHPAKPTRLGDLSQAFSLRYEVSGNKDDLDDAIKHLQFSSQLTPDNHLSKCRRLYHLGLLLKTRYDRHNSLEDLDQATTASRSAAQSIYGLPLERLKAAKAWFVNVTRHHTASSEAILEACEATTSLLPHLSWMGVNLETRHQALSQVRDISSDAAAVAIELNQIQLSLEWLEHGCTIIWSQALQLRSPVQSLEAPHPHLAHRLTELTQALRDYSESSPSTALMLTDQRNDIPQKYSLAALEYHTLLQEIRQKEGFQRFLLPRTFSELRSATRSGVVIIVNISHLRSDAIILTSPSADPHHIRFEYASYELYDLESLLHATLYALGRQSGENDSGEHRGFGPRLVQGTNADGVFRHILGRLWEIIVKPCVDYLKTLELSQPGELLHIHWCLTGSLVFLPIHAAGLYREDGRPHELLSDFAISSYAPSLSWLLNDDAEDKAPQSEAKLLIVAQPNTPNQSPLPGTMKELQNIRKRASGASIPSNTLAVLEGPLATVEEVLSQMDAYSCVHFACHGVQDLVHPLRSGLLLQDGRLELFKLMHTELKNPELAFLSACQTATGDRDEPEEAIHLAAGMLSAGYKGVIATMWSIPDNDAPFVADQVYARLFESGRLESKKAAAALHSAVQLLREKHKSRNFTSWVPFIHLGR